MWKGGVCIYGTSEVFNNFPSFRAWCLNTFISIKNRQLYIGESLAINLVLANDFNFD